MTPEERRFHELTAHYERLQDFLRGYALEDILCAIADKAFIESERLKALGYQGPAEELERLADIVGCLNVPGLPTVQKKG
jgi:hypothetical protein